LPTIKIQFTLDYTKYRNGVLEAMALASRTTGHVLGLGLGSQVLGLGKHVLGLKYFSVL